MRTVTIVEFTYSSPEAELAALAQEFVENVQPSVEGLLWKIFLHRPEVRRAGGVYLFRDLEAARAYVNGAYVAGLRKAPLLSEVSVEVFGTLPEASARAGAPL